LDDRKEHSVNPSDSASNSENASGAALAAFAFEMGVLKRLQRAGWSHAGVGNPESVAEHSLRVAQLASLIASEEGADPARAALLAIWHDSQETRTGDLPHTARPYVTGPKPEAITADQTAVLPDRAAKTIREAVAEYEARTTLEAACAYDADKLECLIQAVEYRAAGNNLVQGWIDSSRAALKTETAKRIANAAETISPLQWRAR
jgi:putative hydrolases of HD superfamily